MNARTEGSEDHGQRTATPREHTDGRCRGKAREDPRRSFTNCVKQDAPSGRHDGVKRPDHRNGVQAEVNHPAAKSNARAIRTAGVELQRDPERLQELGTKIDTVEKVFYPPWPGREDQTTGHRTHPGEARGHLRRGSRQVRQTARATGERAERTRPPNPAGPASAAAPREPEAGTTARGTEKPRAGVPKPLSKKLQSRTESRRSGQARTRPLQRRKSTPTAATAAKPDKTCSAPSPLA